MRGFRNQLFIPETFDFLLLIDSPFTQETVRWGGIKKKKSRNREIDSNFYTMEDQSLKHIYL